MSNRLNLAAQFVNSTASHIFLTGKAGTGKTTFLHNLARKTHKNYLVVAPTGIAALNAQGVTIHSQFLLPFGTFLPEELKFNQAPQAQFYTRKQLASRNPLNSARKKVLRNIDLLIIDEVSMLRADLLDALDYRLKSVKGNYHQSFGGVQLLMIGDLYQLPPIVKDAEWQYMQRFYNSPHFFESRALKQDGFTYIELDKIFRQQDEKFISVLNNLRNNQCTAEDLALLNSHYQESATADEGVITITTHNYRADQINRKALDKLDSESKYYEAEVDKDFPEHLFPLPESLELREGAQVMFIKNDSEEQRFFNGKLATVVELSNDGVCVSMEGDDRFWLSRHTWENKKYQLNESTKELEEEVVGSFTQFPIKLAWAITVHKSQGLTFDKAVIDVGQAFAPGQVYVALSRLRSLEGLRLRTKISEQVVSSDAEVVKFSAQRAEEPLEENLQHQRKQYLQKLLTESFDFSQLLKQIEYVQEKMAGKLNFEDEEMSTALQNLHRQVAAETGNTRKFRAQINKWLLQEATDHLAERLHKARTYYWQFLHARLKELLIHLGEVKQLKRTKTYQNLLQEIDQLLNWQISQLQRVSEIYDCILNNREIEIGEELLEEQRKSRQEIIKEVEKYLEENPKNLKNKTGKKRKKGETYQITYKLFREGLSPEEIAENRGLRPSTIYSHLARGVADDEVNVEEVLDKEALETMRAAYNKNPDAGLMDLFRANDNYAINHWRIALNSFEKEKLTQKPA